MLIFKSWSVAHHLITLRHIVVFGELRPGKERFTSEKYQNTNECYLVNDDPSVLHWYLQCQYCFYNSFSFSKYLMAQGLRLPFLFVFSLPDLSSLSCINWGSNGSMPLFWRTSNSESAVLPPWLHMLCWQKDEPLEVEQFSYGKLETNEEAVLPILLTVEHLNLHFSQMCVRVAAGVVWVWASMRAHAKRLGVLFQWYLCGTVWGSAWHETRPLIIQWEGFNLILQSSDLNFLADKGAPGTDCWIGKGCQHQEGLYPTLPHSSV